MYICNYIFVLSISIQLLQAISFHKIAKPDKKCPCKNATLCNPIPRKQNKVLAGFTQANGDWSHYDLNIITELILTSEVDGMDSQLLCLVHSKGVQLHTTVKLTNEIIFDSSLQEQWIRETIGKLNKFHLDGVSISYEENLPESKHSQLSKIIDRVYSVLKTASSSYQLSFSVSWYLEADKNKLYKELSKSADYFLVREFGMSTVVKGPPCYPGPNAPIYGIVSSEFTLISWNKSKQIW